LAKVADTAFVKGSKTAHFPVWVCGLFFCANSFIETNDYIFHIFQEVFMYGQHCSITKKSESFLLLPESVARIKELTAVDKLVYGRLAYQANGKGRCWPSQEGIAEYLGITRKSVNLSMIRIQSLGLIRKVHRPNKSCMYILLSHSCYKEDEFTIIDDPETKKLLNSQCNRNSHRKSNPVTPNEKSGGRESKRKKKNTSNEVLSDSDKSHKRKLFQTSKSPVSPNKLSARDRIKKAKRSTPSPVLHYNPDHLTRKVEKFLRYWNSQPIRKHTKTSTKVYGESVEAIYKLINGKFFSVKGTPVSNPDMVGEINSRTVLFRDWKRAVDHFVLSSTDNQYFPIKKQSIKRCSLKEFLYNPNGKFSYFLNYFFYPPKRIHEVKQIDPILTNEMIKIFENACADRAMISEKAKDSITRGANKLHAFMQECTGEVQGGMLSNKAEQAKLLWDVILTCANNDPARVNTFWFEADWVFEKLPIIMKERGYIRGKRSSNGVLGGRSIGKVWK
jgi:hypothetical protein